MSYVKVSSKYQVTLPKKVREGLSLEAGNRLYVTKEGNRIILKVPPKVKEPTKALYGSIKSQTDAVKAIRAFRESGGS